MRKEADDAEGNEAAWMFEKAVVVAVPPLLAKALALAPVVETFELAEPGPKMMSSGGFSTRLMFAWARAVKMSWAIAGVAAAPKSKRRAAPSQYPQQWTAFVVIVAYSPRGLVVPLRVELGWE